MNVIPAWLFFVANCSIPFASPRIREDRKLMRAVLFVVVAHQLVSLLQCFLQPLPTVNADPIDFLSQAEGEIVIRTYYTRLLNIIFAAIGGSHLLGCQFSQLAFALSLIVFVEIGHRLGQDRHLPLLVIVYGCLPSCLLNTSVILREAWQILLFMCLVLSVLDYQQRGLTSTTMLAVLAILVMPFLHNGLGFVVLVFPPLLFTWATKKENRGQALVAFGLLGTLAAPAAFARLAETSAVVGQLREGRFIQYVDRYQEGVVKSRTEFAVKLDLSSPTRAVVTTPIVIFQYLFSPMPWEVKSLMDVYGLLESGVRLALFVGIALAFRKLEPGEDRQRFVVLFLTAFCLEAIWASGTANWGTAFRHRLVAYPLIVLLGGAPIFEYFQQDPSLKSLRDRRSKHDPGGDQPVVKTSGRSLV